MSQQRGNVVVSTPSGQLRGSVQTSHLQETFYAFKGIPYAKPPLGPLRFRDPEPVEPWNGVRDSTRFGPMCAQYDEDKKTVRGSEDCLYANVYTKTLKAAEFKPVMVWIHGGALLLGSGEDVYYGPDFLLSKDVVLVTFNYRLGVLGFFNLEDEVAPGNQGLKDQVMLLQWVKTHISSFGGDPNNVTLFGASAGALSVNYLAVSPLTKGLIHKVIIQSGCLLNPWAEIYEPKKTAYEFLDILGCKERNSKKIVEFLRTISYTQLIETQEKFMAPQKWIQTVFPFGPGVDDKSSNPLMPIPLSKAAEKGIQVPLIIGYNSLEGIFAMNYICKMDMKELNENFSEYISPQVIAFKERYGLTIEDLKKMYLNSEEISEKNMPKFLELWSDITFTEGTHRTVSIQCRKGSAPTYFYKFSYDYNPTVFKSKNFISMKGASHGEELSYLFYHRLCEKLNIKQFQDNTGAEKLMRQMVELWTNFAKTGRPTIAISKLIPTYWQPVAGEEAIRYLDIDEDLRMKKMINIQEIYRYKMNIDDF